MSTAIIFNSFSAEHDLTKLRFYISAYIVLFTIKRVTNFVTMHMVGLPGLVLHKCWSNATLKIARKIMHIFIYFLQDMLD